MREPVLSPQQIRIAIGAEQPKRKWHWNYARTIRLVIYFGVLGYLLNEVINGKWNFGY